LARAMIRGEPAIGRDQSREPRLYSVEPVWGADYNNVWTPCWRDLHPLEWQLASLHWTGRAPAPSDRQNRFGGFEARGAHAMTCKKDVAVARNWYRYRQEHVAHDWPE
jgi:hypothetical protein